MHWGIFSQAIIHAKRAIYKCSAIESKSKGRQNLSNPASFAGARNPQQIRSGRASPSIRNAKTVVAISKRPKGEAETDLRF